MLYEKPQAIQRERNGLSKHLVYYGLFICASFLPPGMMGFIDPNKFGWQPVLWIRIRINFVGWIQIHISVSWILIHIPGSESAFPDTYWECGSGSRWTK
jgi:hypothetical protein